MQGASSFDGKLTGNRQMVDRYNEAKGKKAKKGPGLKTRGGEGIGAQPRALPHDTGGHSSGEREEGGFDQMKDIKDEHGNAISHHVFRTHQGYHSVTQHEDGFVHAGKDHDSLDEAQEYGKSAMGDEDTSHVGDMPKEDYEIAEQDEAADEHPSRKMRNIGSLRA